MAKPVVNEKDAQRRTAPAVRSSAWLARWPKWFKKLQEAKPKLRPGAKLMVDTKTYRTFPVFTVEMWHKARRQYLPLQAPDGSWKWDNEHDRDCFLAVCQEQLRANKQI